MTPASTSIRRRLLASTAGVFAVVVAAAAGIAWLVGVSAAEYAAVCREAEQLGSKRIYVQPAPADTEFLPDFTSRQPFRGNRAAAAPPGEN